MLDHISLAMTIENVNHLLPEFLESVHLKIDVSHIDFFETRIFCSSDVILLFYFNLQNKYEYRAKLTQTFFWLMKCLVFCQLRVFAKKKIEKLLIQLPFFGILKFYGKNCEGTHKAQKLLADPNYSEVFVFHCLPIESLASE